MNIEFSIKNYRCFSDRSPTRLKLCRGASALVGANNVGKSTLLRLFYELRPLFQKTSSSPEACLSLFEQGFPLPPPLGIASREDLFHQGNFHDIVITLRFFNPLILDKFPWAQEISVILPREQGPVQAQFKSFNHQLDTLEHYPKVLAAWREVFLNLSRTIYAGSFRGLATQANHGGYDLRNGKDFINLYREMAEPRRAELTNAPARLEAEVKNLFRLNHFSLISPGHDQPLIVQMDDAEYLLEEVGSGLAQVIQLYVHALALKPDFILIDEPECHLHPSFQSEFVTTLSGMARLGMIFSTHNGGLAKSAADRTYLIERSSDDTHTILREIQPEQRLSEVLGELSFSSQQQQGCTKVLLVEGPTEIKAVRQILNKMKAGKDIVLLPLGGGSMITPNRGDELAEVKKIGQNVYALVDSEKSSLHAPLSQDRIGFRDSCQRVGISCHILERRSFENYFSDKSIQVVFGKKMRALGPFEDIKERYPYWPKTDNWKVVRDMSLAEWEKTDLGRFLQRVVDDACRT